MLILKGFGVEDGFDLPNNIWWWLKIMKRPIVELSPFSRYK
jgi:hypothetical protein